MDIRIPLAGLNAAPNGDGLRNHPLLFSLTQVEDPNFNGNRCKLLHYCYLPPLAAIPSVCIIFSLFQKPLFATLFRFLGVSILSFFSSLSLVAELRLVVENSVLR